MGGITSSTGLVSGINTGQIIEQLLAVESRPKQFAQRRLVELQTQQAAYLDITGRLNSLKSAAAKFRTARVFESAAAVSSDDKVLTATARAGAAAGSYSFIVDRLVSTQQMLSRGFTDRNATGVGSTSITFEPDAARLDTDTSLSVLNGGEGVTRGKIRITDSQGRAATVDLSRVATVGEVLRAINSADGIGVRARVDGDKFVLEDTAGGQGAPAVTSLNGGRTAESLGLTGAAQSGAITGTRVYGLGDATALASLNDGLGVRVSNVIGINSFDFQVRTRDGSTVDIDLGDLYVNEGTPPTLKKTQGPVSTFGQAKQRIEQQSAGRLTVEVNESGTGFRLIDNTTQVGDNQTEILDPGNVGTAADLGLSGTSSTGVIESRRLLAGMNTVLASNLRGGRGLTDGAIAITARNGTQFSFSVSTSGSVDDIVREINTATGGAVRAGLDRTGTGLVLTDTTGGTSNLIVAGLGAEELGIKTADAGVASNTVNGERTQKRYLAESTLLSSLNGGQGLGVGRFEITGPGNLRATVGIDETTRTIGDVIRIINSRNIGVRARINDKGDGIRIEVDPSVTNPSQAISVRDVTGNTAAKLNLVATASDEAADQNFIDGSFEKTVALGAGDTLDQIITKINQAKVGVNASVVRDGQSATPFRLRLTSTQTGEAGRFVVSGAGADLGLNVVTAGSNSRVFFGSEDPAEAVLIESTTNSIADAIDGVTVDLKGRSTGSVSLNVARDNGAISTAVNEFVDAYNAIITRLNTATSYDKDTERKGPLLGDGTANELRSAMAVAIQRPAVGVSGSFRVLSQVGVSVGRNGTLQVDQAKLTRAIEQDPQGVNDLFAGFERNTRPDRTEISPGITVVNTNPDTFQTLGVAEQIVRFVDRYADTVNGRLTRRNNALTTEIESQNQRIAAFDVRLASRRAILERQFTAMEEALSRLQGQQNALQNFPRA
jgi:flagellar hook-associated protein 2